MIIRPFWLLEHITHDYFLLVCQVTSNMLDIHLWFIYYIKKIQSKQTPTLKLYTRTYSSVFKPLTTMFHMGKTIKPLLHPGFCFSGNWWWGLAVTVHFSANHWRATKFFYGLQAHTNVMGVKNPQVLNYWRIYSQTTFNFMGQGLPQWGHQVYSL